MFISLTYMITVTAAQDGVPNELRAFVERTAAEIGTSPLKVSQFASAKVDAIENLGKANGADRYLCWLKADPNRVGYIAVAGSGKSFQVLAFSATVKQPDYFLKHLKVTQPAQRPLNFARVKQLSSVANVPLVTATGTFMGGQPFDISELAASVSSVLNYSQSHKKILLFRHVGLEVPVQDPEYARRFRENPASAREPNDPSWRPLREERQAILARASIPEGRTSEEKAASKARAHDIVKPMIRRRLLDPVNARERWNVLEQERADFDGVVRMDISLRARDAILLQMDYLNSDPKNLQRDIELFFKTRGRTVQIEALSFEKTRVDALPAVIIGPPDTAGVLLGYVDIDGERFASVFIPRTGSPIAKSRAQKLRELRAANGLPPEPSWEERVNEGVRELRERQEQQRKALEEKGIRYVPPEEDIEQTYREGMERIRIANETTLVLEDRHSVSPARIESGVHLVRCSTLTSWQTMHIAEIGLESNWGWSAVR
jgi:hypothetical protein